MLGPFVYVFFILAMEVCQGIFTYGTNKGVGVHLVTCYLLLCNRLNVS